MIQRQIHPKIAAKMGKGKAIIIIGPRQVGKTTLIHQLIDDAEYLFLDGDDPSVRQLLNQPNTEQLKSMIGHHKIIFIDEAQRINNIGLTSKIIADQFKDVQLIVSGSSAFELKNELNEPLTGRKWEYQMYPITWGEFEKHVGYLKAEKQVELRLIYGMYPEIINQTEDSFQLLKQLTDSYLFKDILSYGGIRRPEILDKLLRALAFQIGHEVSYNEIAQLIGADKNTVSHYIDLLEKSFIIFSLKSFSRNLRNEIKTNQKIYFYDNGIRNMVIGNFNSLDLRQDTGALWENFIISERKKQIAYTDSIAKAYFWRTVSQQEIDYIEDAHGEVKGYEIKWSAKAKVKRPKSFQTAYNTMIEVIHRDNFRSFIN
jgi:uncharacterized protein